MEEQFHLNIGGSLVGVIRNLRQDWPHWIGDFEPTAQFEPLRELFSKMAEFQNNECYKERDELLMRLFQMGMEVIDSGGGVKFKRTSQADLAGEIGIISIANMRISFRTIGKLPPRSFPR